MSQTSHFFHKYLFVVNPISGDKDKDDILSYIQDFCKKRTLTHVIFKTTGEEDEREIRKTIQEDDPEVVVAVGGDGTVNLVAKIVSGTKRVLGIIPMGSGNGLSKDLNIPQNNKERAV